MNRSTNDLKKLAEDTIKKFGGTQQDYYVTSWYGDKVPEDGTWIVKKTSPMTPVVFVNDLTINEISMLNGIFEDWKLNLENEVPLKRLVDLLNGELDEQNIALKELRESIGSTKCSVIEETLIENGLEEDMAKFVVTKLANEWVDCYWLQNNFSKENMVFLKNTDIYKYIMGAEVSLERIYKRKEKIMKIYEKTKSHEQARKNIKSLHEDVCKIYDALELLEFDEELLKEIKILMNDIARMFLEL